MMRAVFIFMMALVSVRADVAEQEARFRRLPPGTLVSPPEAIAGMALALGRTNPLGFAEKVTVADGKGFDVAMRMATRRAGAQPWAMQAGAKTVAAVKRGDVMLAVFWARAAGASQEAQSAFVFEHGAPPYEKSVRFRFVCGREWERFFVPFTAARDEPAGAAMMYFHGGHGPQVIEIAGLEVYHYARTVALGDLPYTPITYKGREAGAKWRAEAEERIQKQRTAPMYITVRDSKGKLMPWTTIRVRQVRHAYEFGSAVAAEELLAQGADADMYRDVVARSFNKAVLENDLKWPQWEQNRQRALDAVAWLRERRIGIRGHTLLWPGWSRMPADTQALAGRPEELRKRILAHVRDITGALAGQVEEWDVVNEAVTNTDVQQVLGAGILAEVFKAAHEADPKARLFINDYSILSAGGADTRQQDAYFKTIRTLIEAKAPVHGIGMQGHFDDMLTPPARVWEILDRFAALKLPVKVTEFDVNVWDEQAMADYTRDFMTAVFAHPSTTGILIWGFWEKRHWLPNAAHWSADWQLRAPGKVWHEMVYKKWWTDARVQTNGKGVAKLRGFLGDYEIELGTGGSRKTIPLTLTSKGEWKTVSH